MVYGTAINVVWSCRRPFPELQWPEPLPSSVRFYGLQKKGIGDAPTVIANKQQLFLYIDLGSPYDAVTGSNLKSTPSTLGGSN